MTTVAVIGCGRISDLAHFPALMKMDESELLEGAVKEFFGGMGASTGTLWEYAQRRGSHDHGFASFAAIAIDFIENC